MRIKLLLLLLLLLVNSPNILAANWQNFFWRPDSASKFSSTAVTINDTSNSSRISLSLPKYLSGQRMTVIASSCNGNNVPSGNSTYWIQYKQGWNIDPSTKLRYRLYRDNWMLPTNGSSYPNWSTRISQHNMTFTAIGTCWRVGESVEITMPSGLNTTMTAYVEIDRGSAVPGKYTLRFPYRWMFEEHKMLGGSGSSLHQNAAPFMANNTPIWYGDIPVTITSRCELSSYDTINLSHGRMSAAEAKLNKTRPHTVNIRCDGNVPVRLKLTGNNAVSGKTSNFTQCGTGGSCELLFDNNKYEQNITISNSKSVSITSTYHPTGTIKEGAFSGSGILSFLVL
ncbi:hypothetical protein [Photobacterium damselae]|uniref:hypothetical protein n=1 Tax=Photobacterium damselae TaxID=38293 RepID=UPI0030F45FEE